MTAFCDATCPKCKRRYGWHGEVIDWPPCPHCGHRVDPEIIKRDADEIADFKALLAERPLKTSAPKRVKQRQAAGLSFGQAVKILGIHPIELKMIETGEIDPLPDLEKRMIEAYGLDPL